MIDQAQKLRDMMNKENRTGTRVITVTSGKGGVGKSSFSINTAINLSMRGKKVLLIDTDFGFPNIDIMLGVSTKYNLSHVISGEKSIRDIVEKGKGGVNFISGGSGLYELIKMDEFQMNRIIHSFRQLDDIADIVIFDTGSGLDDNILRLIRASHDTIIVTTTEPTAIMDAYSLIKIACERKEKPDTKIVVNKAESDKEGWVALDGLALIAQKYIGNNVVKLGCISRDENVVKSVKMQEPLMLSFPQSKAALDIVKIMDKYLEVDETSVKSSGIIHFLKKIVQS